MKITNCFTVLLLLLLLAFTTALSRTVTDYPVQYSKLHEQELITEQLLISSLDNVKPKSLGAAPDHVAAEFGEVIGEASRLQPEELAGLCVSKELCIRKKVICVKKCRSGNADAEVGLHHFPKCQVVCRKCVPNC